MKQIRPKKHLGQHFLMDLTIAKNIVNLLQFSNINEKVIEIGPGMGVLTNFLVENKDINLFAIEIDEESVHFLGDKIPNLKSKIFQEDFLEVYLAQKLDLKENEQISIIGNFPYNISSQIFFKVLHEKNHIGQVVGMLQKEVAERIASKPGNKQYGILSVLLQAFYDIEYCFTVPPESFNPPPKVQSGVIRLIRNYQKTLNSNEKNFKTVIKLGFNQRRKKLRNALKSILQQDNHPLLEKRAEQLSYTEFDELTEFIYNNQ